MPFHRIYFYPQKYFCLFYSFLIDIIIIFINILQHLPPKRSPSKSMPFCGYAIPPIFFQFTKIFLSIKIYFNRHIYYLHKHFATFPHPIGSYQRVCHIVDMPFCQHYIQTTKKFLYIFSLIVNWNSFDIVISKIFWLFSFIYLFKFYPVILSDLYNYRTGIFYFF